MPKAEASHISSVLFLTYHFPPEIGGIQTRIRNYIICLNQMGIKVSVLSLGSRRHSNGEFTLPGVDIFLSSGNVRGLPTNLYRVFRVTFKGKADVIHVFSGGATLTGSLSLLLARLMRKRAVLSIFGREDLTFASGVSKSIFGFSASICTSITSNSDATKSLLSEKYQKKVRILLGGANMLPESSIDHDYDFSQPNILFVGRLVRRKGVDDLLEAFARVKAKVPATKLVIAGDGPDKARLVEIANRFGLTNDVEFRGALIGEELQDCYQRCTVFVLPSKLAPDDTATEGLGLALIEASMHAKPLVGTRHGGIPEIIKDGENGLLVSEANPEELSEAITKLLTNVELAKRTGEKAMEMAKQKYSWESATKRLLEAYGQ